ncbi:MAG: acyl-CoA dehydrogenase family protein, partial [Candidatus Adiutricales bacterium]
MANVEIDLQLNDEQKAMRDMVRKFGAEVIRPVGVELDKLNDPADVIAKDSRLWDMFRQYRELGLHKAGFAKSLGGAAEDMDPLMSFVILEELGYADVGLAISLGVAGMPFTFA